MPAIFFRDPFKEKFEVEYSVKKYRLPNEKPKQALVILWQDEKKPIKKVIMLDDPKLLSEYMKEMIYKNHVIAVRKLINFSELNLKKKGMMKAYNAIQKIYKTTCC